MDDLDLFGKECIVSGYSVTRQKEQDPNWPQRGSFFVELVIHRKGDDPDVAIVRKHNGYEVFLTPMEGPEIYDWSFDTVEDAIAYAGELLRVETSAKRHDLTKYRPTRRK